MPKLTPLKPIEVIKKLKKLGFEGPIPWWRHAHMIKGELFIPIPLHGWKELWVGIISAIINEAWITREEWMKL